MHVRRTQKFKRDVASETKLSKRSKFKKTKVVNKEKLRTTENVVQIHAIFKIEFDPKRMLTRPVI